MNGRNQIGATSSARPTSSTTGMVMAAAALRALGSGTPADGSALMIRSTTAARMAMWT
jgi:hypothetical protein